MNLISRTLHGKTVVMLERSRIPSPLLAWVTLAASLPGVFGQTTQGLIFGRVTDDVDRAALTAKVTATQADTGVKFEVFTDGSGFFVIPLVPPGVYVLLVERADYRSARIESLEVPVGGFVEQNVSLRLLTDLWDRQFARRSYSRDGESVLLFYGPDVDVSRSEFVSAASTVKGDVAPSWSSVARPDLLETLPLAGRDVYQLIALDPGVTSDLATLRGVGVSVNGQRPSSGSFSLDGLDNNNYLISGPYAILPTEAIAEYRISTNNFSAEYGGTSGYLANAATRAGGDHWHGLDYSYLMNEGLDGNDPSRKRLNEQRLPLRDFQQGLRIGGPLVRDRLFGFGLVEHWNQRSWGDAQPFLVPTEGWINSLPVSSAAASLLRRFAPPPADSNGQALLRPPHTVNRVTVLNRVDWSAKKDRISGRFLAQRQWAPDFVWSPYQGFNSALRQNATSGVVSHVRTWTPSVTSELRAGIAHDLLGWNQTHPEIPELSVPGMTLPGSPARYFFENHGHSEEISGNLLIDSRRQFVKAGGGIFLRATTSSFTPPGAALTFGFPDLAAFAQDAPGYVIFPAARDAALNGQYAPAQTARDYRYGQAFFFFQESLRVTDRLLLSLGARYDSFGAPLNTGSGKDWLIQLGGGSSLPQKLVSASFLPPRSGNENLYHRDPNNWAPRVGFAWNLSGQGTTILRGGYGIFYDRPFDNLWQNLRFNNAVPGVGVLAGGDAAYLHTPLASLLSGVPVRPMLQLYPLTLYQPGIRTPYVQSFFASLEQRLPGSLLLRVAYAGSLGRELLTTDLVNRLGSTHPLFACPPAQGSCRYSETLNDDVDYRANQGSSAYHAGIVSLDYRARRGELHAAYTFSHAIDNQSDPLAGLLSANLEVTNLSPGSIVGRPSGFTEQFNSSVDRASSDFDQRQTLVFYSTWDVPSRPAQGWLSRLTRNWRISQLAAVRSGLSYSVYASASPFTIYAAGTPGVLNYNRASLLLLPPSDIHTGAYADGVRLLNPNSFADPGPNQLGNLGRNALTGPGLFNLDLSVSRSFSFPMLGEAAAVVVRADAYNVLNHANLNNPGQDRLSVGDPNFGVAVFGRTETSSALFSSGPLTESARRIQLMLRISF